MTPEGYKQIDEALLNDFPVSTRYKVSPEPREGQDVEFVSVSVAVPHKVVNPAFVLNSLAKAKILTGYAEHGVGPRLEPINFQEGRITFRDMNSEGVYETPSEPEQS